MSEVSVTDTPMLKTFEIEVKRTSFITIQVEAENSDQAEAKAWAEVEARGDSPYADWEISYCKEKDAT